MTDQSASPSMLPYGRQDIDDTDIEAVVRVLRSDFLTTGPAVPALERALSERLDGAHVIVCSNGTAALHLMAMMVLQPGDVVVVPAITFLATANAARYVNAEVEFADVDPDTGLVTPDTMQQAIRRAQERFGRAPRLATVVHMGGQCGDLPALSALAVQHRMILTEDAAHAVGTRYRAGNDWYSVGGGHHSAMTSFSFHPVKTMTMGEGGAVTTRDPVLAEKLAVTRNHGMRRDPATWSVDSPGLAPDGTGLPWYYEMNEPGYNYRATDLQAALGLSQLSRLDGFVARRTELTTLYRRLLADLAPVVQPVHQHADCEAAWHLFVVRIDFAALGLSRLDVVRRLQAKGIGTQVHYIPLYWQPYYRNRYGATSLQGAEEYYASALSLPLFSRMTDGDVERVVAALAEIVRRG